jgi:hypothetical protein
MKDTRLLSLRLKNKPLASQIVGSSNNRQERVRTRQEHLAYVMDNRAEPQFYPTNGSRPLRAQQQLELEIKTFKDYFIKLESSNLDTGNCCI